MYLTTENAEQYVGKKIDSKRRLFHYYPLEVIKTPKGVYMFKDRTGTCMYVPKPTDLFNSVSFDFVVDEDEAKKNEFAKGGEQRD